MIPIVKAEKATGIVEKPEEYRYSSAKDYADEKGLLEIEIVIRKWKTCK
ncbi:MAG TPA: hypothetical protein VFF35_08395 [Bacteroidia bacterium]|nr:hypothetical protein [Bacteroidia bacterium]